jgi:hypothetical protein
VIFASGSIYPVEPAQEKSRMANMLIPAEERNLNPDQVEALDKRRTWGLTLQSIAGLCATMGVILWLWVGQDLTYSPGWIRPMFYYDALLWIATIVLAITGTALRRGASEF